MSKSNTIVARRRNDGTVEQVMPDGATRPFAEKTDWGRLRAMTDEEVTAADEERQRTHGGKSDESGT